MRALQEMLGHRDFKTTLIYADYAPTDEAEWIEAAFGASTAEIGSSRMVVPLASALVDALPGAVWVP